MTSLEDFANMLLEVARNDRELQVWDHLKRWVDIDFRHQMIAYNEREQYRLKPREVFVAICEVNGKLSALVEYTEKELRDRIRDDAGHISPAYVVRPHRIEFDSVDADRL
jgi:hypothetical protein